MMTPSGPTHVVFLWKQKHFFYNKEASCVALCAVIENSSC